MNKKTYDTILWDLDGTIIQSHPGIFNGFLYALGKIGIVETDTSKLYRAIGPGIQDTLKDVYHLEGDKLNLTLEYYREYYGTTGLFEYKTYEGIPQLIRKAKNAGKKIGLATAKPQIYAVRVLERIGISDCFDFVGGNILQNNRLSKSEIIDMCLEKLEVTDKSSVVLVGDTKYDAEGAIKSGIDCVGVLYGYGDKNALEKATVIADDLQCLENILI
ncbi:MAG: HAD hydrolase-like protein [Oscillospiraceae bacterium]